MSRLLVVLVVLLVTVSACTSEEPAQDPEPDAASSDSNTLPSAYASRLADACTRSIRVARQGEGLDGVARQQVRIRSTNVVERALHFGPVPPQAKRMLAAFDEYFQTVKEGLANLKRADRFEAIMSKAWKADDLDRFKQASDQFVATVEEGQALFKQATGFHELFLGETRRFGIEECYGRPV